MGAIAIVCLVLGWAPAGAVDIIGKSTGEVVVAVGQGRLLQFAEPVDSVLIGDLEVADLQVVSPQIVYVFGKTVGRTNLFAVSRDERIAASLSLSITRDPGAARVALGTAAPNTAVQLTFAGNQLVASGTVRNVEEAVDVAAVSRDMAPSPELSLNRKRFPAQQQINLRVRFAEVSRNDVFRLGINWNALISIGDDVVIGLATGAFIPGVGSNPDETFGSGSVGIAAGDINVNLLIDALQREGLLTILAEPNLTTVTGETARFLAGGEIPIPVPLGDETITIEFKPFGVSLDFTPTLLPDERIGIRVLPEVSQLTTNGAVSISGFTIPALVVRRAETTVELASGQTFAIAGLFQRNIADDVDKLPFLGDIPILGKLFQSVRYQRAETELVILITPYLVQPSAHREMGLPTDPRSQAQSSATVVPQRSTLPAEGLSGFIIN